MITDPSPARPPDPPTSDAAPDSPPAGAPDSPPAGAPGEPAGAPGEPDGTNPLPRVLEIVGSIVAPTTLLTALLFYFGLLYAVGYYRYFGVNFTVLDLPAQGFLILSASTAVLPLALFAVGTLLSLGLYRLPLDRLSGWLRQAVRWGLTPAVGAAGVALVLLSAADALFHARVFPTDFWEARGLSLTLGLLLLVYVGRMRRLLAARSPSARRRAPDVVTVATWGSMFILVSIGLFWAVGSYAIRVGEAGAQGLAAELSCAPEVVLYSERSLNLQQAGVREELAPGLDGAYGFRYAGLKLVPQAGEQYLLLPAAWVRAARPAIVLPRSDALRLEFLAATC